MYACFALAAPLALPLARAKPWRLLAGSLALWALAPFAAPHLPHATDRLWDFNPFAWQLLFVLGLIARAQPVFERVSAHRLGQVVTLGALTVVVIGAATRLSFDAEMFGGELKRNLAWFRALNFASLAWLTAHAIRSGLAKRVAQALPWIGLVGRKGLVSFVAGAVISLVIDSMLYWHTDGYLDVPLGLLADGVALASLVAVARVSDAVRRNVPVGANARRKASA